MKLLLLQINMFFANKEIKKFIRTFLILFPITLGFVWFLFTKREEELQGLGNKLFHKQFVEIMNMSRTTNYNTILDQSKVLNHDMEIVTNNFWRGNALHYRYLEETHDKPY